MRRLLRYSFFPVQSCVATSKVLLNSPTLSSDSIHWTLSLDANYYQTLTLPPLNNSLITTYVPSESVHLRIRSGIR
ncbi:hypothetical protein BLNAU_16586 [Blattamonas nauphoetae]|uniref:Uncharacterized protein n=1 Tax=Blattamonas nauphoetae TaxID=2049346 RepID=A0ABQ9X895_9EUKA|nr:hypothetical protein BLNAU_16586 [Blattamonas nauphoetae]